MPRPRRSSSSRAEISRLKGKTVYYHREDEETLKGLVDRVDRKGGKVHINFPDVGSSMWFEEDDSRLKFVDLDSAPSSNKRRVSASKRSQTPMGKAHTTIEHLVARIEELLRVPGDGDASKKRKRSAALRAKRPAALGVEASLPPSPRASMGVPPGGKISNNASRKETTDDLAKENSEINSGAEDAPVFRKLDPKTLRSTLRDALQLRECRPIDTTSTVLSLNSLTRMARSKYAARLPAQGNAMQNFQESVLRALFACGDEALALVSAIHIRVARADARAKARAESQRSKSDLSRSSGAMGFLSSDDDNGFSESDLELDSDDSDDDDGDDESRLRAFRQQVKERARKNARGGALKDFQDTARTELAIYLQEIRTVAPRAWLPTTTAMPVQALQAVVKAAISLLSAHERSATMDRGLLLGLLRCTVLGLDHITSIVHADACHQVRSSAENIVPTFCVLEDLEQPELLREHVQQLVQASFALHGLLADLNTFLAAVNHNERTIPDEELVYFNASSDVLRHAACTTRRLFSALTLGFATHAFSLVAPDDQNLITSAAQAVLAPMCPASILASFKIRKGTDVDNAHSEFMEIASRLMEIIIPARGRGADRLSMAELVKRRADLKQQRDSMSEFLQLVDDLELGSTNNDWDNCNDWPDVVRICAVFSLMDLEDTSISQLAKMLDQEDELEIDTKHEQAAKKESRTIEPKRQQVQSSSNIETPAKRVKRKEPPARAAHKSPCKRFKLQKRKADENVPGQCRFPEDNRLLVGRAKECHLRFTGKRADDQLLSVSRRCAELSQDPERGIVTLHVLASLGIRVDGEKLEKGVEREIREGSRIRFTTKAGNRTFEYILKRDV
ncbi:Hypothetical Protein FCC1311_047472 [Hondaea fermentalgiana]|uniref:FHA domain-containing protein n=1 Tax=Hondaea fermentalgiana TaxID=2315210 RepID=A0A2R5GKX6_9STRA|nr:Hypothetical Protein FCC1311_047472 [Hondaea fermentalgiana]|eukprot:GBG28524.1 Hypothetical Protein FCC1311_047472 [Hondaea fermentalgiana]